MSQIAPYWKGVIFIESGCQQCPRCIKNTKKMNIDVYDEQVTFTILALVQ